jgi:hypothetical protein
MTQSQAEEGPGFLVPLVQRPTGGHQVFGPLVAGESVTEPPYPDLLSRNHDPMSGRRKRPLCISKKRVKYEACAWARSHMCGAIFAHQGEAAGGQEGGCILLHPTSPEPLKD